MLVPEPLVVSVPAPETGLTAAVGTVKAGAPVVSAVEPPPLPQALRPTARTSVAPIAASER